MKYKRIAYALCGEGFGHYGRSIGIIKQLAVLMPDWFIDVYCYDYTFDMISKDKNLPKNITVNYIPGFRLKHNKKSEVLFFESTLLNWSNWKTAFKVLRIILLRRFVLPFIKKNREKIAFNWTNEFVKEFDIAVSDWDAMLPRVSRARDKKYILIDSIHLIQYCAFYKENIFNLKDWYFLIVNRLLMNLYHSFPSKAILTTVYNFDLRRRYLNNVKMVGPLVRKEIIDLKDNVKDDGFILVYIRNVVREKVLPVIRELKDTKFVVFTEKLKDEERMAYQAPNVEFHDTDPGKFIDYLSRCSAVLSTSGYTLISESIILKKPFYAVVLGGILGFEQKLSLYSMIKAGCGDGCEIGEFNSKKLKGFIDNLKYYKDKINVNRVSDGTGTAVEIIRETALADD